VAAPAAVPAGVDVSLAALEAFLSNLTAGPTAHRAQQATAQQQLLLAAVGRQTDAAARQERALAARRRQLLSQVGIVCCLVSMRYRLEPVPHGLLVCWAGSTSAGLQL
jgi:hypothetical protein